MKFGGFGLAAAMTLAAVPVLAPGGTALGRRSKPNPLFAHADANGDGSLTLDECKTFKRPVAEKRAECCSSGSTPTATGR